MKKRVLNPERLRKVPPQFSWIDHRLVQENYFLRCDHSAWALYLFLTSVADAEGLSYYSDASLVRRLKMDPLVLSASRQQLIQAGLIAYEKPLYQVLSLEPAGRAALGPGQRGRAFAQGDGRSAMIDYQTYCQIRHLFLRKEAGPAPDCSRTQTGFQHGAQVGAAGELQTSSYPQAPQQAGSVQGRHHSPVGTTRLFGSADFPATQGTGLSGPIARFFEPS